MPRPIAVPDYVVGHLSSDDLHPLAPAPAIPNGAVPRPSGHQQSSHLRHDRRPSDLRYHAALHTHGRDMAVSLNPSQSTEGHDDRIAGAGLARHSRSEPTSRIFR